MSDPHKIMKLVFKFLVVKSPHEMKLLHSNAFPIVLFSLVNNSMATTTNDALLGEIVCDTVQELECKFVRLLGGPDGDDLNLQKQLLSQPGHDIDGINHPDDRDLPMFGVHTNLIDTMESTECFDRLPLLPVVFQLDLQHDLLSHEVKANGGR